MRHGSQSTRTTAGPRPRPRCPHHAPLTNCLSLQALAPGDDALVMHRSDLELKPLLSAIARLSYIPWHMLAGRPGPGMLMGRGAPSPSQWSSQYDELAQRHDAARRRLQEEAEALLPLTLRELLLASPRAADDGGAAGEAQASSEPTSSSSNGDSGDASSEQNPAWLQALASQHSIPGALRHAWTSSRTNVKELIARLAMLRLSAAAVAEARRKRDGSKGGGGPPVGEAALVVLELEAAAANVVVVARLLSRAAGRDLVLQMYTVMRTLSKPLPQVIGPVCSSWMFISSC